MRLRLELDLYFLVREIINYKKPSKLIANLFLNLEKQKNKIKINEMNLIENEIMTKLNKSYNY